MILSSLKLSDRILLQIWQDLSINKKNSFYISNIFTGVYCNKRQICYAFNYLKKAGFIKKDNNRDCYHLTKKGKIRALINIVITIGKIFQKHREWDGKWRLTVFDVPERKRQMRDNFRRILVKAGFKRYQKSVWLFPHQLPDEFMVLVNELKMGNWVKLVLAERIHDEKKYCKAFRV